MPISPSEIPKNVISVTSFRGKDIVFQNTPLSLAMNLSPRDVVPDNIPNDVLFWVESCVLETPEPSPGEVRRIWERLGMTREEFGNYVGLPPGTIEDWGDEPFRT